MIDLSKITPEVAPKSDPAYEPIVINGINYLIINGMRVGTIRVDSRGQRYCVTPKGVVREGIKT